MTGVQTCALPICGRCKNQVNGFVGPVKELCEEVESVRGFCYLGDRVNTSGGCEAAVTARARIGWVKFKECGELLNSKRFSLRTGIEGNSGSDGKGEWSEMVRACVEEG